MKVKSMQAFYIEVQQYLWKVYGLFEGVLT